MTAAAEQTARVLIIPATRPEEKITVTVMGPNCADRARVIKVLAHLFSQGDEWDGPPPNVELIGGGPVPAEA